MLQLLWIFADVWKDSWPFNLHPCRTHPVRKQRPSNLHLQNRFGSNMTSCFSIMHVYPYSWPDDPIWRASFFFGCQMLGEKKTDLRPRMPVTNEAVGWDSRTKKCNPGVTITRVGVYIQTISFHPNIFQMGWFNMVQPPTRWQFNTRCFCPLTTIFVDLCLVIPIYNHGFS